jgi:hypothetical protein
MEKQDAMDPERQFEDREKELEENRSETERTKIDNDVENLGISQGVLTEQNPGGADKDFPDLAPSKSMEFPDGLTSICNADGRWKRSLVDGCWRIFLSILFFWYGFTCVKLIYRFH